MLVCCGCAGPLKLRPLLKIWPLCFFSIKVSSLCDCECLCETVGWSLNKETSYQMLNDVSRSWSMVCCKTFYVKMMKNQQLLTVIRVHDFHRSNLREFKDCHHWLRQNNLEGLWDFILAIWQDADFPCGCGLAWVELHLFLRFPLEIFVLFCSAILCSNTFGRT